jgi:hypothetical protein
MNDQPPLKPLHPDESLIRSKLVVFEALSTERLVRSLAPGNEHCLKARADGTMLDGHHRIHVLRQRGENVDLLPREILESSSE